MTWALSQFFVNVYRIWHGRLHLPGAGKLLRLTARFLPHLRAYPMAVPGFGSISLNFRDEGAYGWTNYLFGECAPEASLVQALDRFVRPNTVFWDVGGHVGLISAHFASPALRMSKVFLFEPQPVPFAMAASLFTGHSVVTALNYGLSDVDGQMILHCQNGRSSMASVRSGIKTAGSAIRIPVFRGDTVVAKLGVPPPDVVKIDVEGHEEEVIRGMREIMRTRRPVVAFEHLFLADSTIAALNSREYVLRTIARDGTLCNGFSRANGKDSILIPIGGDLS